MDKECNVCHKKKPLIEFYKNARRCKACQYEKTRRAVLRDRESKLDPYYIYIIINPAWPGYLKIGRARSSEKRLLSYQTSSPHRDYELKFSIYVRNPYWVERHFRDNYTKTQGEWIIESIDNAIIQIKQIVNDRKLAMIEPA